MYFPSSLSLTCLNSMRMARIKGEDIAAKRPDQTVISADTIVVREGRILGKPRNAAHALHMLSELAGNWHDVITGFCVLHVREKISQCHAVTTRVHMIPASAAMLRAYIATEEPMDKAGAYGIQGAGAFLVDEVRGSYTNVVGLPVPEILRISSRSEERRVGKECRSRWSPYH